SKGLAALRDVSGRALSTVVSGDRRQPVPDPTTRALVARDTPCPARTCAARPRPPDPYRPPPRPAEAPAAPAGGAAHALLPRPAARGDRHGPRPHGGRRQVSNQPRPAAAATASCLRGGDP